MTDNAQPAWEPEAETRAINAEPWEPPPGMVKRQCQRCDYLFATPEAVPMAFCPDCSSRGERPRARERPNDQHDSHPAR
jgi:hypothetical protein